MLLFVTGIRAIYFLHKKTQLFLGELAESESSKKLSKHDQAALVTVDKGLDFSILEATKGGDHSKILIRHPNLKALDSLQARNTDGNPLIFHPLHGDPAQRFNLLLLSDDTFALEFKGKCTKYDDIKKALLLSSCENLDDNHKFDLYYEVKAEEDYIIEDTYNLKEDMTAPKIGYINVDGPYIKSYEEENITDIEFQDGKAITKSSPKKPFDAQIGHSEIHVKPPRQVVAVEEDSKKVKNRRNLKYVDSYEVSKDRDHRTRNYSVSTILVNEDNIVNDDKVYVQKDPVFVKHIPRKEVVLEKEIIKTKTIPLYEQKPVSRKIVKTIEEEVRSPRAKVATMYVKEQSPVKKKYKTIMADDSAEKYDGDIEYLMNPATRNANMIGKNNQYVTVVKKVVPKTSTKAYDSENEILVSERRISRPQKIKKMVAFEETVSNSEAYVHNLNNEIHDIENIHTRKIARKKNRPSTRNRNNRHDLLDTDSNSDSDDDEEHQTNSVKDGTFI